MKTLVLAVAALALAAGSADAGPKAAKSSVLVGPEQPIPYSQLKAYSAASAKAKATKDWWSAGAWAATGASTDVAASASATPIDSPTPSAANPGVTSSQPASAPNRR